MRPASVSATCRSYRMVACPTEGHSRLGRLRYLSAVPPAVTLRISSVTGTPGGSHAPRPFRRPALRHPHADRDRRGPVVRGGTGRGREPALAGRDVAGARSSPELPRDRVG